jgi:hypothetical protein
MAKSSDLAFDPAYLEALKRSHIRFRIKTIFTQKYQDDSVTSPPSLKVGANV